MQAVAQMSTEQLEAEIDKRTAAEQLQARLQPKIDAETAKHLAAFKDVVTRNYKTPVAEWTEKDAEKLAVACRELGIEPKQPALAWPARA